MIVFFTSESVWLGGRPGNLPASIEGVHFEYFVKFNLENLQGARLRKATFTVTKLAATLSDELRPEYDGDDEDDHVSAWAVPQALSSWTQSNLTRRFVEETAAGAQRSIGTRRNIGLAGMASFDVTSDVTDLAGRIVQGVYSFRVSTANRRRRGASAHFNSIYTTMNNKLIPPELLLELELPGAPELSVTDTSQLSDSNPREAALSWPLLIGTPSRSFTSMKSILPLESARITAREGGASPFGGGSAEKPAGLRSCDYKYSKNKPYEWFVKFDVSELRGQDLQSVSLSVSKCKSRQECVDACKQKGTCTCDGGGRACGGGNIDAAYDATSDDLHLWHVANRWGSDYSYPDYSKSWTVTWKTCDQQTLQSGQGGLEFAAYLGSVSSVGDRGTATFSVTDAVRQAADSGDGILSFRFTVTGAAQRFFVAQGAAGGPALTATVQTVVKADITQYEVQRQSWDGHGVEPSSAFVPLYLGAAASATAQVPRDNSALVRVRAVTQADMPGAAVINGPWSYATLFRMEGICLTSTTKTSMTSTMTASMTSTITMSTSMTTTQATATSMPTTKQALATATPSTAMTATATTTPARQTAASSTSTTQLQSEVPSPIPSRPVPMPMPMPMPMLMPIPFPSPMPTSSHTTTFTPSLPTPAVKTTSFDTEMEVVDAADVKQFDLTKFKIAIATASGVDADKVEIGRVEYRTKVTYSVAAPVSKAAVRTAVAKSCNVPESWIEVHAASRRLSASRRLATSIEAIITTQTASEVTSIAAKAADSALLKQAFAEGGLTVTPIIAMQPENAIVVSIVLNGGVGAGAPVVPSANAIQREVSDKVGIRVVAILSSRSDSLALSTTTLLEEPSEDDVVDKGFSRLIGFFSSALSLFSIL